MHQVDQTTEQMVRSVLAYAENRLRMDPVPLDKGTQPAADLYKVLNGVIRDSGRSPDEVLGIYSSVIAPSIISADSPRFLGFIPAAPTKASLLFDMLISCASIQGISWLEASGRSLQRTPCCGSLPTRRACLNRQADASSRVGPPAISQLLQSPARRRRGDSVTKRRGGDCGWSSAATPIPRSSTRSDCWRCPLWWSSTPDHRLTADAVNAALDEDPDVSDVAAVVGTSGTTNAGIIDDLAGVGEIAKQRGWWFHVDGAYGGSGIFARSLRDKYAGHRAGGLVHPRPAQVALHAVRLLCAYLPGT